MTVAGTVCHVTRTTLTDDVLLKMSDSAKIEFAVQMTCQKCVDEIKKNLNNVKGIQSLEINLEKEQVIVETSLPSEEVKQLLEQSGKRAVIMGYGSGSVSQHLGAAVAMIEGPVSVKGVTRLVQIDENKCVIDGTLDGLTPGKNQLSIHELGDISLGCESCGKIYNPPNSSDKKPIGDLGQVLADETGRAVFRMESDKIKVWDVIGRSMIIAGAKASVLSRMGCGIIARSAGLFQNSKKICACDGVVLWDERDVPIAGAERSTKAAHRIGEN
ncbi:copper chaperone for superoxide dismutase isoform X1 [Lingula anatina]|uniref:Superoxide dismutase 1 copper chaperone n=2 Tax=Lingula anatina TaxID=7574 RepID=A0A1S3J429_LINAN|nr:copper chaperone for superoxide dismutase isoform X1 [Lingula anatina]|eukprot:XP_013404594.1 copper chaperone for superoxide dismutase isoform X1 [Lingula anatina]